ncbi:GFA family protein [Oxalobacteraceae sp. CFBP 8763]|nr:GFA family protein [Oxalobacteraceae sp. CFBP 8763]
MTTFKGSCHCGSVRYEADIDLAAGTVKCNCSICTKLRFWAFIVAPTAFHLLQGHEMLRDYRFGAQRDGHAFCSVCGVHVFTTVAAGPFVAVTVASLDDLPVDALMAAPVRYIDGRNDNWHTAPAEVRHL